MPIYRETLKAEARVLIQSNKPLRDDQRAVIIIELEQLVNSSRSGIHQLIKINQGIHVKASLRLHLKEMK